MTDTSFTYEKNKNNWDKVWKRYGDSSLARVSWSKKRILATLDSLLQPGRNILDAGCGTGFFSSYFCSREMNVTAIDYSQSSLELTARATNGKAVLVCDDLLVRDLANRLSTRFDLVFSDGLLEHFSRDDQIRLLGNFRDVLGDKGIVVTFVPNKWSPWQILRPFYLPGIKEAPFTLSQLVRRNEQAGLEVFRKGGLNTLPVRFSPDRMFGASLGMLLFTFAVRG